MEFENVIQLIRCVSESNLTSFTLEDGNTKITMSAEKENAVLVPAKTETVVVSSASQTIEESVPYSEESKIIKSPLVGVFYSSASPQKENFVKVGDHVHIGQTLGIVEAMKLMNEIESEFDGVVKEILVGNEQVVEYGQSLFVIEP